MKNFVRALIALLLVASLSCSLCSCLSEPTITPINTESDGSSTVGGTEPENKPKTELTIEGAVLFSNDNITVSSVSLSHDPIWGDGVKLLIENNSDHDVGVSCDELIVNGYMISNLFSKTVAAGKKSNEILDLSATELEKAGIETVEQIEAYFHLFDTSTYDTTFKSDCVLIKTSVFSGNAYAKRDSGRELFVSNGVRIVGKEIKEDEIFGKSVVMFIENTSAKNVVVQCDNLSVNGYMIDTLFSATVYAGKMAIDEITLSSTSLENNGITKIENVELTFKILDENTFDEIAKSEPVSFTVG